MGKIELVQIDLICTLSVSLTFDDVFYRTHNDLMSVPDGQYKRLVEFQSMDSGAKKTTDSKKDDDDDDDNRSISTAATEKDEEEQKNEDKKYATQARALSRPDLGLFLIGSIGSILAGVVFPGWGVSIDLFFYCIPYFLLIFLLCLVYLCLHD